MRVLLRCDGGTEVGVGHVVRSLALAEEALARGHTVALLGRLEGELLGALAAGLPGLHLLGPAGPSTALAEAAPNHDVVHVDHYGAGADLLERLSHDAHRTGTERPLLSVMADGSFGARPADLLVDPTLGAEREVPPAHARWHLRGSRFTPVRSAFRSEGGGQLAPARAPAPAAGGGDAGPLGVLVVMGGTDPGGCSPLLVEALGRLDDPLDVTVVSAPGTARELAALRGSWGPGRLRVITPTADLPERMARADVVVSAAGTSTWELCALSRPMALVAVVDNQRAGYDRAVSTGAAVGLGDRADLEDRDGTAARLHPVLTDAGLRRRLAAAAHRIVDGLGAWRVVSAWEAASTASAPRPAAAVTVRPARPEDASLLLEWRNDPLTRSVSRNHDRVEAGEHLAWLRASLSRTDRHLLMGVADGADAGTVRWDRTETGEWEVSITVAPAARGRGLAGPLLRAGEEWLAAATDAAVALAVVHRDNTPSRRLFLNSGYVPDLPADDAGFERWLHGLRSGPS